MVPAGGAAVWGLLYSAVYQRGADAGASASRPWNIFNLEDESSTGRSELLCHGVKCYAPTFWAMAASVWLACVLWFWAWRGPGGWVRRGIAV